MCLDWNSVENLVTAAENAISVLTLPFKYFFLIKPDNYF